MSQQTALKVSAVSAGIAVRDASHADRQRRYRCRRAAGLRSVEFEIRNSEIAWLVRRNYLHPDEMADNDAIGRALGKLLDKMLK